MSIPFRKTSRALVTALALSTAACGDQIADPAVQPAAARMIILSGDAQTVRPGQDLPQPIVVKVVDEQGNPVPNQIVNFRVLSYPGGGEGSVYAGAALTNAQGIAQERWTLGTRVLQRLEVRAVSTETGERQLFGTFTAFAREPLRVITVRAVTPDSTRYSFAPASNVVGDYTYEWDTGNNAGTFRKSGTSTPFSATMDVVYPNSPPDNYWFCSRVVSDTGQRSAWECFYFGSPFRTS